MKIKSSKFALLSGLLVLGVLTVVPSTGWLVREQLRVVAGHGICGWETATSGDTHSLDEKEKAAAAARPSDFGLQLAWALRAEEITDVHTDDDVSAERADTDTSETLKGRQLLAILPLRARFDDRAELQADILRFLCCGDFRINRSEENILLSPKQQEQFGTKEQQAIAENKKPRASKIASALAVETAQRGEKLDPRNAYFPTMLAAAYLSEHHDAEAFAALARAASKTEWNDYDADEARARISLLKAGMGAEPGGLARAFTAAVILFPHFAQIRDEARVMTALAVQKEITGDRDGGFQIRQSMGRIGAIMRVQPRTIIGSLVGVAITAITDARPGGAAALDLESENGELRTATRESRYVAYLTQIGHPEEATWFLAERAAAEKMAAISRETYVSSDNIMMPYIALNAWWVVGLFCLISILTVLGLGCLSAFLARTPRIQRGLPLHLGIGGGLMLFAQIPLVYFAAHYMFGDCSLESSGYAFALILIALNVSLLFFLKRNCSGRDFLRNIALAVATVAASCGAVGIAIWLGSRASTPFGLADALNGTTGTDADVLPNLVGRVILGALALGVPSVAIVVLAIKSRLRRLPASVGIVRGLRDCALPMTGILLFVYAAICGGTFYEEAVVRNAVYHQITDEGAHCAAQLGVEWPGPVAMEPTVPKDGKLP